MVLSRADRTRIGCLNRQDKLKQRSTFPIRRGRKLPAVTLDDHPADGQSQPHSMCLCRRERAKYTVQPFWIDSRSGVLNFNNNGILLAKSGSHAEHSGSIRQRIHSLQRIADQVRDDLLQLISMADDRRQPGELGARGDQMIPQLLSERLQHPKNHLVDIDWLPSLVGRLEQGANAVEHFAGAVTIADDLLQSCPYLLMIGWGHSKKPECRIAICHNCCKGLPDLVRNRSSDRLRVQELVVSFALQQCV